MRIQSFKNMESEYKTTRRGLESDDLEERKLLLDKYKFSIIVEGEYSEIDNLENWIGQNIREDHFESIYYGKTTYNYGFVEYFFSDKEFGRKLKFIVPNIFTIYPNAYPSQKILKTDGCDNILEFNSSNKDAIILPE